MVRTRCVWLGEYRLSREGQRIGRTRVLRGTLSRLVSLLVAPALLMLGGIALAQSDGPQGASPTIALDLTVVQVVSDVDAEGRPVERFETALDVAPGSVLEYRLVAQVLGIGEVRGLVLDLPIAEGTTYVAQTLTLLAAAEAFDPTSWSPSALEHQRVFRRDEMASYAPEPLMETVTVIVDGKEVEEMQPLPLSAYRHARVVIEVVEAGRTVVMTLRTRVR